MIEYNFVYLVAWGLAILSLQPIFSLLVIRLVFFLQLIMLSVFAAVRFETGYDWPVYKEHYQARQGGDVYHLDFEPFYNFIVDCFLYLDVGFSGFLAALTIVYFLIFGSVAWYLCGRYSVLMLAVLYSVPNFYLIPVFSLIRFSLAAVFFYLSMMLFINKKYLLGGVFILLAVLTHEMLLVGFVIFVFSRAFLFRKNVFFYFLLLGFCVYFFQIDFVRYVVVYLASFFSSAYAIYLEKDVYNASLLYRSGFLLCSLIIALFVSRGWARVPVVDRKRLSCFFVMAGVGLLVPLYLFSFPTITTRVQYLMSPFIVSSAIYCFRDVRFKEMLVVTVLLMIVLYLPFYRFLSNALSVVYVPYQSVLFYDEENSTGQERSQALLDDLFYLWGD